MCKPLSILPVLLALLLAPPAAAADAPNPAAWADAEMDDLLALYRHLHANPELAFAEEQTAARIAEEFREAGLEVTTGVGGTGVVGVLENGEGPTLLLRTELDALPLTEQTDLPFASTVRIPTEDGGETGVMHACGHDLHMTNLVGVARFLAAQQDHWAGTVLFIAQPAEEIVRGARAMLDDGLYERFGTPDYALALHVDPTLPAGQVGYRAGYILASADSVDITVHGEGGHGAQPHTTIDPVVQASQLVVALQTIVAREVSPIEPAVVTVGAIRGGTVHNVIADRCELKLTVRSYAPQVRQSLLDAIERKARGIAEAAGAPEPDVRITPGTDPVYNDGDLVARVVDVFREELGDANVLETQPSMGAEDFGLYSEGDVPIFLFRLGAIEQERMDAMERPISLHSPFFHPDAEPALRTGIRAMSTAALDLLGR